MPTATGGCSGRSTARSGDPAALDAIIERQFFTLHGWKLAGELTNYRRFFDVGSLVGIRTEHPAGVRGLARAHRQT